MSNINNLNKNLISILTTTATNYELSIDNVDGKSKSIFLYYDTNKDKILQKEELAKLKQDLQNANSYNNKNDFSQKEIKSYLKNIKSNTGIKAENLNSFISDIIDNYKSVIKNEANGEIESFEQGDYREDCWLLSQLNGLNQTTWGKEAIKNSVIKNPDTNSYTIKFAGVNFETTITQEDILNARERIERYSDGDLDVLLFELATERYLKQEVEKGHIVREEDVLKGNVSSGTLTMQYFLTGKTGHCFCMIRLSEEEHKASIENVCKENEKLKNTLKHQQNYVSNAYDKKTMAELLNKISKYKNCAMTCSFCESEDWYNAQMYSKDSKTDNFSNQSAHSYTIKNIVKDSNGNIIDIELSNPWDSDTPIHKTLDEFLDKMSQISITTEDDNYDELKTGFKPCVITIE